MVAFERATVGLFLWWSANAALVDNPCRLVFTSRRFNVDETTDRIANSARERGFEVRERTDHAALAKRAGFHLRPTQSLLLDGVRGADPLRLVVWQARGGPTMVSLDGMRAEEVENLGPALPALLGALSRVAREGMPA